MQSAALADLPFVRLYRSVFIDSGTWDQSLAAWRAIPRCIAGPWLDDESLSRLSSASHAWRWWGAPIARERLQGIWRIRAEEDFQRRFGTDVIVSD